MLPRVVMNVISVMSAGFLPYFRQNMVPKLATGIAITTVLILFTTSLTPHTLKKKVEAQRNHYQAEQRGYVNLRAADNLLEGQLRHAASDNHQGGRNRYVAHHRYRTGDDIRRMNPERHQQGCHGSRQSEPGLSNTFGLNCFTLYSPLMSITPAVKMKNVFGMFEQGSIEDGLRTEDARNDRVSDEAHVGKHQGETYHSLVIMVLADEARYPEAKYQ